MITHAFVHCVFHGSQWELQKMLATFIVDVDDVAFSDLKADDLGS